MLADVWLSGRPGLREAAARLTSLHQQQHRIDQQARQPKTEADALHQRARVLFAAARARSASLKSWHVKWPRP